MWQSIQLPWKTLDLCKDTGKIYITVGFIKVSLRRIDHNFCASALLSFTTSFSTYTFILQLTLIWMCLHNFIPLTFSLCWCKLCLGFSFCFCFFFQTDPWNLGQGSIQGMGKAGCQTLHRKGKFTFLSSQRFFVCVFCFCFLYFENYGLSEICSYIRQVS